IDNTVVRNPVTDEPYIPGSSLKGKMRSLMEWRSGKVQENPLGWGDSGKGEDKAVLMILRLFGLGGSDKLSVAEAQKVGPTRLAFWDCQIDRAWAQMRRDANELLTEAKSENSINRITGVAQNPRQTERVPAGASFDFHLSVKVLDMDDEKALIKQVFTAMKLLEMDSLGGSGSRGYGKVSFKELRLGGEDVQKRFEDTKPFEE
ncbi:MAG: type III-A CRISPR-associated RAMP protein Csm3, partial [Duodenibacillus sp.]|nr:type III-A CRISPR-associated RAMP protein Csm3 [Duodenibacillus sp.]